jgi:hypothetical protein
MHILSFRAPELPAYGWYLRMVMHAGLDVGARITYIVGCSPRVVAASAILLSVWLQIATFVWLVEALQDSSLSHTGDCEREAKPSQPIRQSGGTTRPY